MTMPIVSRIFRGWAKNPPTHVLVGAYFGIGKKEEKPQYMDAAAAREWMKHTGGKVPGVGRM